MIRETISSPASRDADIVGCLQPTYLNTICNRMQEHYSKSAIEVNKEQTVVIDKMKEVYLYSIRLLCYIRLPYTYCF